MVTLGAQIDDRPEVRELLVNIKAALPELEELLATCNGRWGYEDAVYRFYHQSWEVYEVQRATARVVSVLQSLAPERELNPWFREIVAQGTGQKFEMEHNRRWLEVTRPILEAFFHARYFLEMVIRYGNELEEPPALLPSGWASVLYLYGLR